MYKRQGSYTVECKVKNANGISDGSITKTFEIEKTIMNGFGGFVEDSEFNMFKMCIRDRRYSSNYQKR